MRLVYIERWSFMNLRRRLHFNLNDLIDHWIAHASAFYSLSVRFVRASARGDASSTRSLLYYIYNLNLSIHSRIYKEFVTYKGDYICSIEFI